GFVARPRTTADGTQDPYHWDCVVPGKKGTMWERGNYPVHMSFPVDYPHEPPECKFGKAPGGEVLFHPNVYSDGTIYLRKLSPDERLARAWTPETTIKQLLLDIQALLVHPRPPKDAGALRRAHGHRHIRNTACECS
ncbi:hypothetical protein EMIHUDRAFT_66742, partial [Emiliania huxleyi CCMP1516]